MGWRVLKDKKKEWACPYCEKEKRGECCGILHIQLQPVTEISHFYWFNLGA